MRQKCTTAIAVGQRDDVYCLVADNIAIVTQHFAGAPDFREILGAHIRLRILGFIEIYGGFAELIWCITALFSNLRRFDFN